MGVDDTQALISHLIGLRKRLLKQHHCLFLVIFLALVYFANDIYQLVSAPLISKMPDGRDDDRLRCRFTFLYADKVDLHGVGDPVRHRCIHYQVWAFVAPALYKHERRLVVPLLVSSTLLFYIGMAFRLFCRVSAGDSASRPMRRRKRLLRSRPIFTQLSRLRDTALFMAFGVSFEVPVAIVLLCWMGVTTPEDFA
ncbi:twin-arginine translocase subunit TatC [Klebsiella pneumoniae]|nr:twin-arginine translocase subunit TatC [Klebsiella pneumoniae]